MRLKNWIMFVFKHTHFYFISVAPYKYFPVTKKTMCTHIHGCIMASLDTRLIYGIDR